MSYVTCAQKSVSTGAGKNTALKPQSTSAVCESPEVVAYFPPGKDSLDRFISRSMRLGHVENGEGVTGKAIVVFIVESDGSIGSAEILRTSGDKGFDAEAVRITKLMPKWTPAKDKGKLVRSSNMLTFAFRLRWFWSSF